MEMPFNSPVSSGTAGVLIAGLSLDSGSTVLGAGCGNGEFLLRLIWAHSCRGIGVDNDPKVIAAARETARSRGLEKLAVFREADLSGSADWSGEAPAGGFNLAVCLGSTHAFASGESAFEIALTSLASLLAEDGELLVGEGYWKKVPDPDYLEILGDPVGIYRTHRENIDFAMSLGFVPLADQVSSHEEWDAFETAYRDRVVAEAAANPSDAALAARAAFIPKWWDAYRRWGRDTMGFGLYRLRTN